MYLRCDGDLIVDASGYPSCDAWVTVTDEELLGAALTAHKLSESDFNQLAPVLVSVLFLAWGGKQILRMLLLRHERQSQEFD